MRSKSVVLLSIFYIYTQAVIAEPTQPAGERGPRTVVSDEYKFPASQDDSVLTEVKTELWARAWWPADLRDGEQAPIVFLLHGNHATCGDRSSPRHDYGCSYTRNGTCGENGVPVPSHEGYTYIAETLASRGIIAVSINANRGITCNSGGPEDYGLNLARGRLILRHMQIWSEWASGHENAQIFKQDLFINKIDFKRVGLFGHSRGGEGARAAYALLRDPGSKWPLIIPGARIRAIFEIGAVDGQTSRTLDADGTAWCQLLPLCDGDVSDLQGRLPFERMLRKRAEDPRTLKALAMVWGANHNYFNSEWQSSDSDSCEGHAPIFDPKEPSSQRQQMVALELASALFRSAFAAPLSSDARLARAFDPVWDSAVPVVSSARVDRDYVTSFDEARHARVDDFDGPEGMSSTGIVNEASALEIKNDVDSFPSRASILWKAGALLPFLQVNWSGLGEGRSVTGFTNLSFRFARPMERQHDAADDFIISLVDADGRASSRVPLSRFAEASGPGNSTITFKTMRVPLAAFDGVNLARVRGVRFEFDGTRPGNIYLANVAFSGDEPSRASAPNALATRDLRPMTWALPTAEPLPAPSVALWTGAREVPRSRFLAGAKGSHDAVEMTFQADKIFPARDALPYLKIGTKIFAGGRYSSDGKLDQLIFSLPRDAYLKLSDGEAMRVQYGSSERPRTRWNVSRPFTKFFR